MVKIKRIRGRTIKFYLFLTAFSVASTFYILRPVLDVLEERSLSAEKQTAIDSLRAVAKGKGEV